MLNGILMILDQKVLSCESARGLKLDSKKSVCVGSKVMDFGNGVTLDGRPVIS